MSNIIKYTLNRLCSDQQGAEIVVARCSDRLTKEVIALAARNNITEKDLNDILSSAHFYGTTFDMLDWVDDTTAINLSSEQFLCDLQDLVIKIIDPQLEEAGLKNIA